MYLLIHRSDRDANKGHNFLTSKYIGFTSRLSRAVRSDHTIRRGLLCRIRGGRNAKWMQRAWNAPRRRVSTRRSWNRRPVRRRGGVARCRKGRASRTERVRTRSEAHVRARPCLNLVIIRSFATARIFAFSRKQLSECFAKERVVGGKTRGERRKRSEENHGRRRGSVRSGK